MSEPTESMLQTASTNDETATGDVAPTIKTRDDTAECGCLECRNIETTTINRTVLGALVWSVHLFRSYPSILAFAGVIILANRILETNAVSVLPVPFIGVIEAVTAFAFIILIRAYVGTIVAGELTGHPVTIRQGFRRSLARTPALVGVVLLVVFSVMTIPFTLSLPLFLLIGVLPVGPVEMVSFPVAAAAGGIIFAVPFLFLLFKFWFAPEACVIGQYGPLESLRVSWRITTNYRRKFFLIIIIAIGSAASLYVPTVLPEVSVGFGLIAPFVDAISSSIGELLSILWASAYAHIYVQGIVSVS
ncbi:hypothetical protein [Halobellus rufus]|uniref:hypothetical protein n=1 Tax=Halobellus rufus TaxID=1448860 RepID=UPI001E583B78|nr:hypothetical protein [Halobellus rufus]